MNWLLMTLMFLVIIGTAFAGIMITHIFATMQHTPGESSGHRTLLISSALSWTVAAMSLVAFWMYKDDGFESKISPFYIGLFLTAFIFAAGITLVIGYFEMKASSDWSYNVKFNGRLIFLMIGFAIAVVLMGIVDVLLYLYQKDKKFSIGLKDEPLESYRKEMIRRAKELLKYYSTAVNNYNKYIIEPENDKLEKNIRAERAKIDKGRLGVSDIQQIYIKIDDLTVNQEKLRDWAIYSRGVIEQANKDIVNLNQPDIDKSTITKYYNDIVNDLSNLPIEDLREEVDSKYDTSKGTREYRELRRKEIDTKLANVRGDILQFKTDFGLIRGLPSANYNEFNKFVTTSLNNINKAKVLKGKYHKFDESDEILDDILAELQKKRSDLISLRDDASYNETIVKSVMEDKPLRSLAPNTATSSIKPPIVSEKKS